MTPQWRSLTSTRGEQGGYGERQCCNWMKKNDSSYILILDTTYVSISLSTNSKMPYLAERRIFKYMPDSLCKGMDHKLCLEER